jgi:hypothetical protein
MNRVKAFLLGLRWDTCSSRRKRRSSEKVFSFKRRTLDEIIEETGELVSLPTVRMTRTRLLIPENTTFEEWENIGHQLKNVDGAIQFWVGDWINFGERRYGEKYLAAVQATGYDLMTLRNMSYVSSRIRASLRNDGLSYNHHVAVASLIPEVAEQFLAKADADGLSVAELRNEVKEWREEHSPQKTETPREFVFSWTKEPHVAAMLDGMETIKEGVSTLIHDQRDPETAKYLLEMVRKLMIEVVDTINQVLGDDQ